MSTFARDLASLHRQMNSLFSLMGQNYGLGSQGMDIDEMLTFPSFPVFERSDEPKDESAMSMLGGQKGEGREAGALAPRKGESEKMLATFFPSLPQSLLSMSMDVHENPEAYLVSCEIPGVDKSSIDISCDKRTNTLTIKAEKRREFKQTEPVSAVTGGQQQLQGQQKPGGQGGQAQQPMMQGQGQAQQPMMQGQGQAQQPMMQGQGQPQQPMMQGQGQKTQLQAQGGKQMAESTNPRVIRQERSYGMVERKLRLAADAELDRIDAKYENGILRLTIPRSQKPDQMMKKITVS